MGEAARRRITVLICDDHRILTDTLAEVVEQDPDLGLICPPTYVADDAVKLAEKLRPDVVLMDVQFGEGMNGIEATRLIKQTSPETAVVIMTAHEEDRILVEAVEAGASGFLRKTEGVEEFLRAAKDAAAGEIIIDRTELAGAIARVAGERRSEHEARARLESLTGREREILRLSAHGMRTAEIAARLKISPQTVQTHVRNVLAKLGVHSKLEAVAFAVRQGIAWL